MPDAATNPEPDADQLGPSGTLTASPGATIEIVNTGVALHDVTTEALATKVVAQPGQTAAVPISADAQPGTYDVICSIPGHAEAGMVGTLTIL